MTKLTLSKSSLLRESKRLESYERFLPSLDLKRQQLMLELSREESEVRRIESELQALIDQSTLALPMLGNREMDFSNLVRVKKVLRGEENKLGVVLPCHRGMEWEVAHYGLLTKPHWVDLLAERLRQACELQLCRDVARERAEVMRVAARKATQRVNLVSKILIPEAQKNIRKIRIFLSDNERAAVVRSKIAKKKKQALAGGLA